MIKKKITAIVTVIGLIIAMTACGNKTANISKPKVDISKYGSDVQQIVNRGVLHIGVKNNVKNFGYQDLITGKFSGLEVDIAKKIADDLGIKVEYTTVTAATRGQLIDSRDLDAVLATFTITDERKQYWDFSTPYYTDHVSVLVEKSSNITTAKQLLNKTVAVSSGSGSAKALVEEMIKEKLIDGSGYKSETFDPSTWNTGVKFRQYDDYPTISTALSAGEVDAFCVDKSILNIYRTSGRNYIEQEFSPQNYGIVTAKGSGFSKFCEDEIQKWKKDGTLKKLIEQNKLNE